MKQDKHSNASAFSRFIIVALLLCSACAVGTKATFAGNSSERLPRGVIFILIDDIGYGDIDALYPSELETPTLDRLSRECVCLTDFHVGSTCAPTRASLLTGRSVNAGGVWHTVAGRELLRHDEQTMAELFQANGWATGIFGKWHLGDGYPFSPRFRGFDVSVVHGGGGISQGPDFWGNDYYSGVDETGKPTIADTYFENGVPIKADRFCTDFWFERSKQFIRESVKEDKPFFCYLPTNAAHKPFNAPFGGSEGFDGLIENIDANVEQLDEFLESVGIKDDVMLIFTSDNGTTGKRRGGLRGSKGSHYDGGHNVPCFVRWKQGGIGGSESAKRVVDSLTAGMDWLPTFMDLFRLDRPKGGNKLHGISMAKMLLDSNYSPKSRTIVVDTQRGIELEKWKKACILRDEVVDNKITHKWRMVRDKSSASRQLFDFKVDRATKDNLTKEYPDLISELTDAYDSWWGEISPGRETYPPFVVDRSKEDELALFAHSWIGERLSPWHQDQVIKGVAGTGTHVIRFAKPGTYRFELRRWPRADGGAMTGTGKTVDGQKLDVQKARLSVEGVGSETKEVTPDAAQVVFEMNIDIIEPTTMNTALIDSDGKVLTGAYFTYIRQQDAENE